MLGKRTCCQKAQGRDQKRRGRWGSLHESVSGKRDRQLTGSKSRGCALDWCQTRLISAHSPGLRPWKTFRLFWSLRSSGLHLVWSLSAANFLPANVFCAYHEHTTIFPVSHVAVRLLSQPDGTPTLSRCREKRGSSKPLTITLVPG